MKGGWGRTWLHPTLLLVSASLFVLEGCRVGRPLNPFDGSQAQETVILRAENRNLHDAALYLLRGKERLELGTVPAGTLQFFDFTWPAGVPLSLEIQLEVGERYRPLPLAVSGSGRIQLTVAPELRRSSLRG